jgi:hypothetical protein
MRYPLAPCMVLCLVAAGCASPPASKGRATASPALASPRPETFPVQHLEVDRWSIRCAGVTLFLWCSLSDCSGISDVSTRLR